MVPDSSTAIWKIVRFRQINNPIVIIPISESRPILRWCVTHQSLFRARAGKSREVHIVMGSLAIVNPTNAPVCPMGVLPFQKLSAHRAQPLYVKPDLQYL